MTSQAGKQIIMMHTLPNISRSNDNQTMKFGQLIKYNMNTKCGARTGLRTSKKLKLSISPGHQSEHLYSLFLLYVLVENYQNILKLRFWPLPFSLCKTFLKKIKRSGNSLLASISGWFSRKNISYVIFY